MIVSTLLLTTVLFFVPTGSVGFADTVEIVNASFDEEGAPGQPTGWRFDTMGSEAPTPSWRWESTGGYDGGACITGGIEAEGDVGRWVQEGIAIPEGTNYLRITAWIKAEGVRSSSGVVSVGFVDAAGEPVGDVQIACKAGSDRDWTRHVGYVEAPEKAHEMFIACFVGHAFTRCGTFMWDNISVTPVDEPLEITTIYVDESKPPKPTRKEREQGFMLFTRDWMEVTFKNTVPHKSERCRRLTIEAAPGSYEPGVLIVRALRPLESLEVSVSDLVGEGSSIPAEQVDVRSVAFRTRLGQARWGLFNETTMHDVPQFLEKRTELSVATGENQPFWLTVHVPGNTVSGAYRGTVTVRCQETETDIPLVVVVPELDLLAPKGVMFALYDRLARSDEWINDAFADLKAHGATGIAVLGDGGMAMRFENGEPVVEWTGESALERNMEACKQHGLMEPALWLMTQEIPAFCQQAGPLESDAFAEAYCSVIGQIVAHAEASGWPRLVFQPVDEPFEHEQHLELNARLMALLKAVPGVVTEGDGMNGKWENFTEEVYELTDVINLHDGPMLDRHKPVDMDAWWEFHAKCQRDGKKIWFYNIDLTGWHPEPLRYMHGFGLWKSGADGCLEWCYMVPVAESDPGQVYENPAAFLYRYPKAPGESGGPSIAYEAMREGIEDYRHILTLRAWCDAAAREGGRAHELAESIWSRVQAKLDQANFVACTGLAMQGDWTGECEVLDDGRRVVRGSHEIDNGWQLEDYDVLRSQIARGIARIRRAMPGTAIR